MGMAGFSARVQTLPLCRIYCSTGPLGRRAEMDRFHQGGDKPDAPRLFLLSTREGGLGINLIVATTVISNDQDWVRSFAACGTD